MKGRMNMIKAFLHMYENDENCQKVFLKKGRKDEKL
jgi:hypothetical protein